MHKHMCNVGSPASQLAVQVAPFATAPPSWQEGAPSRCKVDTATELEGARKLLRPKPVAGAPRDGVENAGAGAGAVKVLVR